MSFLIVLVLIVAFVWAVFRYPWGALQLAIFVAVLMALEPLKQELVDKGEIASYSLAPAAFAAGAAWLATWLLSRLIDFFRLVRARRLRLH